MRKLISIFFLCLVTSSSNGQRYHEPFSKSVDIREDQHLEFRNYINILLDDSINSSMRKFDPDFSSIRSYENSLYPFRQELAKYFGYPAPKAIKERITKSEKVGQDEFGVIYRLWIEVAENLHTYGILLIPKNLVGKVPLIIAIHG